MLKTISIRSQTASGQKLSTASGTIGTMQQLRDYAAALCRITLEEEHMEDFKRRRGSGPVDDDIRTYLDAHEGSAGCE